MANYDYPIPLDPNTMQPYQGSMNTGMSQQPNFRWQSILGNNTKGFMNNPDLAMALLANSGYSPQKRSFGEILGTSMLQANQMKQGRDDDAFKRQYMQAQMAAMQRPSNERSPYGQYQPGDYTPKSWAGFLQSNDPSKLERYTTPRQEYTPSFKTVTRTLPDGSTELGSFDTRTNEYTWSGQIVPPGQKAAVEAEAEAKGKKKGEAAADLPRVEQNADNAIKVLDDLEKHPGLTNITGIQSKIPIIPGTPQAAADALAKQVEGQAFLQAFQSLKGGGAITEMEGAKAQAAIARLSRAQSTADYKKALQDLKAVMKAGVERQRKQAGQPSQNTEDPLGIR
jgi:hypothetical protein